MTTLPPAELRTLFLFEKLTDSQLQWLSANGKVEDIAPGPVYAEGAPATCFYVLVDGQIALSRRVGPDDVETSRTTQRGVYAGAWQGFLGDRIPQVYNNSCRAITPARFFVLPVDKFTYLMAEWFPMAQHPLEGLFFGIQDVQRMVGQRERLLALGSLSAGLTHELNNPAAAAVRAAASLRDRIRGMRKKVTVIATNNWVRDAIADLLRLQGEAVEHAEVPPKLGPLDASDREDEISDWLDDHGVAEPWTLAPTFVQAGLNSTWLDEVAAAVPPEFLTGAVHWLVDSIDAELLLGEIEDSTTRISTLVGAARQYSQLDRSPQQTVDISELLDSTLVMLTGKIGHIAVVKNYDQAVPALSVYPAELNQVWTNLIDNALAAMHGGPGTLTVSTRLDDDVVEVEIADTGSGIPADVIDRIFEPFYTTKPVGEGTGLGLDISWRIVVTRHHGDLKVQSVPGDTRFQVRLPVAPIS